MPQLASRNYSHRAKYFRRTFKIKKRLIPSALSIIKKTPPINQKNILFLQKIKIKQTV